MSPSVSAGQNLWQRQNTTDVFESSSFRVTDHHPEQIRWIELHKRTPTHAHTSLNPAKMPVMRAENTYSLGR